MSFFSRSFIHLLRRPPTTVLRRSVATSQNSIKPKFPKNRHRSSESVKSVSFTDRTALPTFDPNVDPSNVNLSQLLSLIQRRQYLKIEDGDDSKNPQYSKEFIDFLISWCIAKSDEIAQNRLDPVDAALCIGNVLNSMKLTAKALNKKKKPREKCLVEMARLYYHGLEKLAEQSENVEADPIKIKMILCHFADACCNFDFDPSKFEVDVWPFWFRVTGFFLDEIDSEEKWKKDGQQKWKTKLDFNEAYSHLLSLVIDVTLRFGRAYEFGTIKFAWESRLANHISNFKERNSYILSLRMATLAQKHGLDFDHLVARQLMVRGIQSSFNEYQYRSGLGTKPDRTVQESLKGNPNQIRGDDLDAI